MTGVSFEAGTEIYAKRLQILKEIAPAVRCAWSKARADEVIE